MNPANGQQSADLFSEQVDRLLRGESPTPPSSVDDASSVDEGVDELLSLADELSQVSFRASPAAQATFQNQLDSWFGPTSGPRTSGPRSGRRDTMSGKLIALTVSILVTVTTGAVALVITILVVIRMVIPGPLTETPTPTPTDTLPATTEAIDSEPTSTPVPSDTVMATEVPSATIPSTIDTIDAITVVITIEIEIDDLVPGMPSYGGGDHDDDDDDHDHDDDYHDDNRGHGNDPDHHDEDNPGHGHD